MKYRIDEKPFLMNFKKKHSSKWKGNETGHNQRIDSFHQEMASQAAEITEDLNGKLLFCAEIRDGVVSSAVVFEKGINKIPSFVFPPFSLVDKAYEFWTRWTLEFKNE